MSAIFPQTSFGMRDSHITNTLLQHCSMMPCGELGSRKAMFASMSSRALTAACVFLCEWMCICVSGRVWSHFALRQCIPWFMWACAYKRSVQSVEQSENLPLIPPLFDTQTSVCPMMWVPAGVHYLFLGQVQWCVNFIWDQWVWVCEIWSGQVSCKERDQISHGGTKSPKNSLFHKTAFHFTACLSLCQQVCQNQNYNKTALQENVAHAQTVVSLSPNFVPFFTLELIYHAVQQPIYMENTFNVQQQTHRLQTTWSSKAYSTHVSSIKGFLAEWFRISHVRHIWKHR